MGNEVLKMLLKEGSKTQLEEYRRQVAEHAVIGQFGCVYYPGFGDPKTALVALTLRIRQLDKKKRVSINPSGVLEPRR